MTTGLDGSRIGTFINYSKNLIRILKAEYPESPSRSGKSAPIPHPEALHRPTLPPNVLGVETSGEVLISESGEKSFRVKSAGPASAKNGDANFSPTDAADAVSANDNGFERPAGYSDKIESKTILSRDICHSEFYHNYFHLRLFQSLKFRQIMSLSRSHADYK